MIGRVDKEHEALNQENYAYIIGAEIISSEIDATLKAANAVSGNIDLDMKFNDLEDPNQFYRRSDHWNFGKYSIPFIFFLLVFTTITTAQATKSTKLASIRWQDCKNRIWYNHYVSK
jgi:hypothetical protein